MAKIPHASQYYAPTNNGTRTNQNRGYQHNQNRNYQAPDNNDDDSFVAGLIMAGVLIALAIVAFTVFPFITWTIVVVYLWNKYG